MLKFNTVLAATTAVMMMSTSTAAAPPSASPERIRSDMAALSTDGMEGRKPGTDGETKALNWMRRAFRKAGLSPGRNGWLQAVPLTERVEKRSDLTFRVAGHSFPIGQDVLLLGERSRYSVRRARAVYVGHAEQIHRIPAGAVVLFRNNDAPGRTGITRTDALTRLTALKRSGATAIIEIVEDKDFPRVRARAGDTIDLDAAPAFSVRGWLRVSALERALSSVGISLAELDQMSGDATPMPVTLDVTADIDVETNIRRFTSHNIIGRIPGGKRSEQAILYSAHWDSFGFCRATGADRLCNGTVDNASGIAGLLELARLFKASERPDRTIIFVGTTGEEYGLLGIRAYLQHPEVPLAATVAAFNLDTIAVYPRGAAVGYMGAGLTNADRLIADLVAAQGRLIDTGPSVQGFLKRSDAWPVLAAGVPSFMLSSAIASNGPDKGQRFRDYVSSRYHSPADEMHPDLPVDGAAQDIDLLHSVGTALANERAWIDFLPSAPFSRPATTQHRR